MQSKCFCQFQLECKGKTGTADLDTVNNDVCRVNSDHAAQVLEVFRVVCFIVIHCVPSVWVGVIPAADD